MVRVFLLSALTWFLSSTQTYAGEKSLYDFLWLDPDKKVYVLQNKLYKKENTFYLDLGYLINYTSVFQQTNGLAIKLGHYVHEEWGIELFYNRYTNSDNEDFKNVRSINGADPFVRRFNDSFGAFAIWSPFYGKINTFNEIFYFDWSFGLGLGRINMESNLNTVDDTNLESTFEKETSNSLLWKTNFKLHVLENLHISLEWLQHYYRAPGPKNPKKDTLRNNQDLILSLGFSY